MKIQLINSINENYTAIEQVLTNRGIPYNYISTYLNTDDDCINSFEGFGIERLQAAARALISCIYNNDKALVVIDSDCDGFTSASTIINYLYDLFPSWVNNNLSWFMHKGKQHGLSDLEEENPIDKDIKLIIVPDAGSNDYEYHKQFKNRGIDIIVLDHHEADCISKDAIVINNQLSDYPNKEMSGVGVTWQFCKFIDNLLKTNYADNYLDMVGLGMDADMMSLLSYETKHLILKGFNQVQNPFFSAITDKHAFAMKNIVTPFSVAFYVAPYINAIVRSGTQAEKEIVFQSMLKFKAFERIPSNKRGHKLGEMEQLYLQAMRTITNVKNRQTRAQEAGLELVEKMIKEQNLLEHKVLLLLLKPGEIDKNIAGLVANKLMAKYQRPVCILTRVEETEYEDYWYEGTESYLETAVTKVSYQGSARGCDLAGVSNFKDICESTGLVMYAQGHQGAFGLGIYDFNISEFIEQTDTELHYISDEAIYFVDYLYNGVNVNPQHIADISKWPELWGKDVDEPYVAIQNLKITKDMIFLLSPDKKPTIQIKLPNGVSIMKFNSNEEEFNFLYSEHGYIEINLVGRCNLNRYKNMETPQIIIEDYEVIDRVKYLF